MDKKRTIVVALGGNAPCNGRAKHVWAAATR